MYSKNGDKRVPPGIILPENYSGNAFIKQDGTPSEQPRGNGGSGAQSAEDRGQSSIHITEPTRPPSITYAFI